ncbi:ExeM/NucH family extracellular endonuclease [Acinetobacter sp. WZC-1]|uniref:ExeM/NucH family extracellular endonuclease n=1 Tax=Acinetobacter sp. WZC-1 TaxID=3459034 RepID=UPI00403D6A7C
MKILKPHTLALSLTLMGCSFSSYAQLMFSQYIDGSSNRKGLEIYNPDNTAVNLADYEIQQYNNGVTTRTTTVRLQGSLASKQKFLVGRSELKTEIGDKVNQVAALSFNGDDAVVLVYRGTPVDRFGRIGERPASGWGTSVLSTGNSFKRVETENPAVSIDPTAPFDLDQSWSAWANRNEFSNLTASGTTTPPSTEVVSCSGTDTPIADLAQASQNQVYTVRGVITADYRYNNGFSGFYVQTPDSRAKLNTSNAIFVYIPNSSQVKGGQPGDEVVLRGRLTTYQNQLQIDQLQGDVQTCNQNMADQVQPKSMELPFSGLTAGSENSPYRYQGMLVKIPQTLTVSENYNYGRYGELSLSLGRLFIPTNLYPAKSSEAIALAKQNLLSKVILDDGYNNQNRTPWLPENFSALNTLRSGYQMKNVEGILEYRFNGWRIQPVQGRALPEVIKEGNPRNDSVLARDSKQVRVASFNVLNYDNGAQKGFPTERGATSEAEFKKQHQKIMTALKRIDADVYGLMEIANNGYDDKSAIAYLTKALGADWKYVIPPKSEKLGTDAIAVAIIYNSKRVKPVNEAAVFDDQTQKNRVTMAQTFQPINGGKNFTIIPNHLKSKRCDGATGLEADQNDGQSCWNQTRLTAAQQLMQWIARNPTQVQKPNYLLVGDMNSYAKEDPILAFEKASYKVLLNDEKIGQGKQAYSYVFGVASNTEGYGGAGSLDHAIADENLYPMVKRAFAWHINADEPTALDYNEEYKTDEQKALFYNDDAFRSSDHDPVIVDLDLNETDTKGLENQGNKSPWNFLTVLFSWISQLFSRH